MIENLDLLKERLSGIKFKGEDITPQKLAELIASDEKVSIDAVKVTVLNDDQLEDYASRNKKKGYEEGTIAGEEMATKKIKKNLGIEVEGRDFDKISDQIKEKIAEQAKLPVDQKVSELEEKLKKVQGTYESEKSQWESQVGTWQQKYTSLRNDQRAAQELPSIEGFKTSHILAAMKADGLSGDFDEEKNFVAKRDGAILTDKLGKPITFGQAALEWVESNGYAKGADGRGGSGGAGGSGGQSFKNEGEVYKYAEEKGISPASPEFDELISKIQK